MATLTFSENPAAAQKAVVVVFDLGGFSKFCNHPDHHGHIPKFISSVFKILDGLTVNAFDYNVFPPTLEHPKIVAPDFIKYTGDGAIMLWLSEDEERFDRAFRTMLVATMKRFQAELMQNAEKWEASWCVTNLPKNARFGITLGSVFPLSDSVIGFMPGDILDYAGYCINLAARLQSHCREVGFLIQKCVMPNLPGLKCMDALGMKGAAVEPVWIFESDFNAVVANPSYWKTKFREIKAS